MIMHLWRDSITLLKAIFYNITSFSSVEMMDELTMK